MDEARVRLIDGKLISNEGCRWGEMAEMRNQWSLLLEDQGSIDSRSRLPFMGRLCGATLDRMTGPLYGRFVSRHLG